MTAIANNLVVSFHYTLTNAEGETLDQSQGEPLAYLHGAGNIIPGLEKALEGKTVGEKFTVNVPAAEGYGEYNPDLVQEVPAQMFQGVDNIPIPDDNFHHPDDNTYPQMITSSPR